MPETVFFAAAPEALAGLDIDAGLEQRLENKLALAGAGMQALSELESLLTRRPAAEIATGWPEPSAQGAGFEVRALRPELARALVDAGFSKLRDVAAAWASGRHAPLTDAPALELKLADLADLCREAKAARQRPYGIFKP